jgi:hypothetical protein
MLGSCSLAARGLWLELLVIMHDAEPHGHLALNGKAVPMAQIAAFAKASVDEVTALFAELEAAGVFSRAADGLIYSRRMVRDRKAQLDGEKFGKTGGNPKLKPADSVKKPRKSKPLPLGLTPPLKSPLKAKKLESESRKKESNGGSVQTRPSRAQREPPSTPPSSIRFSRRRRSAEPDDDWEIPP